MEGDEISVLKRKIRIVPRSKENLRGLTVGEKLSYTFYDGLYQGTPLLFLKPRKNNPTPKECQITSGRVSELFGLPVVFLLASGPTYERQRLTDKGVYFIMSDRYAHLPMLIAVEKTSNRKKAVTLTPAAQYILLYHLQEGSLEGLSPKEISARLPYSYESTALGVTCLDDLGLGEKRRRDGQRMKTLHFELKGEDLWRKARPFLRSPLIRRIYCDSIRADADYPVCGINALAHYTRLQPDREEMFMLTDKEYRSLEAAEAFDHPNVYDGNVIIEIWKYPAVGPLTGAGRWVDRLSLALTLKADGDPRVEKEVERMIENVQWKD